MVSIDLNNLTREDWRDLDFYYEYDDPRSCWLFKGSSGGLLKFRDILLDYIARPRSIALSEHEHYGPYWYLKIVTWHTAQITENDIRGTLDDLRRLAELVENKLSVTQPGERFVIDSEFAENNSATLEFEVREDGFDPATADRLLD